MEKELCPATVPLSIGPRSTQIILLRMSWWLFSMMKQDPLPLLLMGYSNLKQKPKLRSCFIFNENKQTFTLTFNEW